MAKKFKNIFEYREEFGYLLEPLEEIEIINNIQCDRNSANDVIQSIKLPHYNGVVTKVIDKFNGTIYQPNYLRD